MATNPNLQISNEVPFPMVRRGDLRALQVNLGYKCNQACQHCHVDAGPNRTEMMVLATIELVIDTARRCQLDLVDLTGGAPELNEHFRYLVSELRRIDVNVIDRCNLTVLEEPGQENLGEFLAEHDVKIVASMPCHGESVVDLQRGKGVYEKSIRGLQKLNSLGYGLADSKLELELVHNPLGAFLPPPQRELEDDYRRELKTNYGIDFTRLLTITNMPIARFRHALIRDGEYESYMQMLISSFESENLPSLMCKSLLSVDWQGYVYDCDFNQMLKMNFNDGQKRTHLSDLGEGSLGDKIINTGSHCFACTAGKGSSCGGSLQA